MTLRKFALATAAASLAIAPVAAQAAPASRASAPTTEDSELVGSNMILLAIAAVAIVVGIILLADNGDDDAVSP